MLRLYCSPCYKCAFQLFNGYQKSFIHHSSRLYRSEKFRNVLQPRKVDRKRLKTSPQSLSSEPGQSTKDNVASVEDRGYFNASKSQMNPLPASSHPLSSESVLFTMSSGALYDFRDQNADFKRKVDTKRTGEDRQSIPITARKNTSYDFHEEVEGVETRQFEAKQCQTNKLLGEEISPDSYAKQFDRSSESSSLDSVLFSGPEKSSSEDLDAEKCETRSHSSKQAYDFLEEDEDDFKPREVQEKPFRTNVQSRPSDSVLFTMDVEASYDRFHEEENSRSGEVKSSHSKSTNSAQSMTSKKTSYNFLVEKEDFERSLSKRRSFDTSAQSSSSHSVLFTEHEQVRNSSSEEESPVRSRYMKSEKGVFSALPAFSTVEDVLDYLASNRNIDVKLYAPIFEKIDRLVKGRKTKLSTQNLIRRKEIEDLSRQVKRKRNALKNEDALEILKVLLNLGVSIDSVLCYDLVKMLLSRINRLELQSLLFLNRTIVSHSQASMNPVLSAFRIAVPMVFETQIKSFVDECDVETLIHALKFALSEKSISNETRQMLVDKLLKRIDQIGPHQAGKITSYLAQTHESLPNMQPLLDALKKKIEGGFAQLSSQTLFRVISDTISRHAFFRNKVSLDVNFIEQAINDLVRRTPFLSARDTELLLRRLNLVNCYCPVLLDRVDEQFKDSHVSTANEVLSYVRACSINMYKPRHWNSYEDQMLKHVDSLPVLPWLRLVIDLLVLQCCPQKFIARCFDEQFLNQCSRREYLRKKALVRLQKIHEIVKVFRTSVYSGPFLPDHFVDAAVTIQRERKNYNLLDHALLCDLGGQEYVLNGVRTELGQVVDHLIVKCKSGKLHPVNPAKVTGHCNLSYESLDLPEDARSIAILPVNHSAFCSSSNSRLTGSYQIGLRCLEATGIAPIPIPNSEWFHLGSEEKALYLKNKINSTSSYHVNTRKSDRRS